MTYDPLLVAIAVLSILTILFFFFPKKKNKTGIPGTLVWTDEGKHVKPFFNRTFQVLGKPDLIHKTGYKKFLATEYKHRTSNAYNSDIAQAKCAALAARGHGYPITRILIKTQTTSHFYDLPASDSDLYREIEHLVKLVRFAKEGRQLQAQPQRFKCNNCAYKTKCKNSA